MPHIILLKRGTLQTACCQPMLPTIALPFIAQVDAWLESPAWTSAGKRCTCCLIPTDHSCDEESGAAGSIELAVDTSSHTNQTQSSSIATSSLVEAARLQLKAQRSEWTSRTWKMTRDRFGCGALVAAQSVPWPAESREAALPHSTCSGTVEQWAVGPQLAMPSPTATSPQATTRSPSHALAISAPHCAAEPLADHHAPALTSEAPTARAPLPPRRGPPRSQPGAAPTPLAALSQCEPAARELPRAGMPASDCMTASLCGPAPPTARPTQTVNQGVFGGAEENTEPRQDALIGVGQVRGRACTPPSDSYSQTSHRPHLNHKYDPVSGKYSATTCSRLPLVSVRRAPSEADAMGCGRIGGVGLGGGG